MPLMRIFIIPLSFPPETTWEFRNMISLRHKNLWGYFVKLCAIAGPLFETAWRDRFSTCWVGMCIADLFIISFPWFCWLNWLIDFCTQIDKIHAYRILQASAICNRSSVADPDPGSGAFLTPGSRIWDPGWVKKSGSGSGMNNPDHISESLETIFLVNILKFFDADPG
jgi:hypothetical protein